MFVNFICVYFRWFFFSVMSFFQIRIFSPLSTCTSNFFSSNLGYCKQVKFTYQLSRHLCRLQQLSCTGGHNVWKDNFSSIASNETGVFLFSRSTLPTGQWPGEVVQADIIFHLRSKRPDFPDDIYLSTTCVCIQWSCSLSGWGMPFYYV